MKLSDPEREALLARISELEKERDEYKRNWEAALKTALKKAPEFEKLKREKVRSLS